MLVFFSWCQKQKPTAVRQWVDKFRERIKTRLPRWSVARSQAEGLSFDSREEANKSDSVGQIHYSCVSELHENVPLQTR